MRNLSLLFFLFIFATNPAYSQTTINIPGDYPTIQAGIDAANNGDIVLVADGTYLENINYKGKAITVASHFFTDGNRSHIENTIIDGSDPSDPDSGSVVLFISGEDTTSVLCGFTITGGSGTYYTTDDYRIGGGILVFLSGAKICHNKITSNTIDNSTIYTRCYGGGIFIVSQTYHSIISYNEISNNLIENSSAVGGGISTLSTGPTWIISNKIINNVINANTGSGGGIDLWNAYYDVFVQNNIIKGNQTLTNNYGGGGIGIWATSSPVFIRNNLIAENTGYLGGGILVDNPTEENYTGMSNFKLNNHTPFEMGGFNNNSFSSNQLLVETVLENNTVVNNSATYYCGGIYGRNALPEIKNSIIWGNQAPAGPQIEGVGFVEYSDVEGGYPGTGNIDTLPLFADLEYCLLNPTAPSPCIDAGNPDPMYNDVEDPITPGFALYPAMGTIRNDMGAYGGSNSTWAAVFSDTIHVPGDYSTIQGAIDAAVSGNVVLVAEDTYYENINFRGKAITVASHFLVDGDTSHISNTIIDGSQLTHPDSGSVVSFISGEDTTSVLCGFTITGGGGTISPLSNVAGGGISVLWSGARISSNIIRDNKIFSENHSAYGGGIFCRSDTLDRKFVHISGNTISNNQALSNNFAGGYGGGIDIWGSDFIIEKNKINDNQVSGATFCYGPGIRVVLNTEKSIIQNNNISFNSYSNGMSNGGGIFIVYSRGVRVFNNLLEGNSGTWGAGIFNWSSNETQVINNTIVGNSASQSGGGIQIGSTTQALVLNTILWDNVAPQDSQIHIQSGTVEVRYSDVQGGFAGEGNINVNPSFSDTLFHLGDSSFCIGAGIDSIDIGGTMYYCPPFCYYGTPRPNPSGSMPDIGACESPLPDPINSVENDLSQIPEEYSLEQNYPNPFNPTTTIKYGISERSFVELRIYDILGREVELLVNEEQDAGYYKANYNATKLASGIYLYQIKAGEFVQTKKMVLLR